MNVDLKFVDYIDDDLIKYEMSSFLLNKETSVNIYSYGMGTYSVEIYDNKTKKIIDSFKCSSPQDLVEKLKNFERH